MELLGIKPKRSLGQNFLISEHVVGQIFKHIELRKPQFIVEVGPGLGTLTERLIERQWPRTLIEYDSQFAGYWRERGESVVEQDALLFNWNEIKNERIMVLGNLPYQIGARLILELSLAKAEIEVLLFMLQKEVAQRMAAPQNSADYGFLSVVAQTFWSVSQVVDASPGDFFPQPNVASRVLAFKRKVVDPRLDQRFLNFVKKAFQYRRKYMLKSFPGEVEQVKRALVQMGLTETVRAEELTVQNFHSLFLACYSENAIG